MLSSILSEINQVTVTHSTGSAACVTDWAEEGVAGSTLHFFQEHMFAHVRFVF